MAEKEKNKVPPKAAASPDEEIAPGAEPAAADRAEDTQVPSGPELLGELERARQEAAANLELAQRSQADLANFRRRVEQEREEIRKYAIESLVVKLIPVLDSLEQAAQMYADTPDGHNPLLDGVRKTRDLLAKVLGEHGVELILEAGVSFDPNLHMPLRTQESSEVDRDTVESIYQPGIKLGKRVIRPATVSVLMPKALPRPDESEAESGEEVE